MTCDCDCHGHSSLDRVCSIEGGCGHLHADEERRCVSDARCVHRARIGPRWVGALLSSATGLCGPCTSRLGHTIRNLPIDIVDLTTMIARGGGGGGDEIVSSSRELPVPIRLGVESLRSEIDFELQYWAEIVAAEVDVEWDAEAVMRMRQAVRVEAASRFLADRLDVLLALSPQERSAWNPDGEPLRDEHGDREVVECTGMEGALRFDELHRRVYQVAGRTRLVHHLTPACPWCHHKTLVRHNGSDAVECETCGQTIDEQHYNWFVAVLIAEEQRRQREEAA